MNIRFTKFPKDTNWVKGKINNGEFYFTAKVFDEGSCYGINEGRVSALIITANPDDWSSRYLILNYDRGWDIQPSEGYVELYENVLQFLEQSPKRFS